MIVAAIIQARMGSSRLPGKVLRDLDGKSVLRHVIERTRATKAIDCIVVATTSLPKDDAIVAEAERCGAFTYRGSEDDVLSRYYEAARRYAADVVVRITSDCPLIDPEVVNDMVERFLASLGKARPLDYISNTLKRTFPRGLDAEVFTMAGLERAWLEGVSPAEREHVTPYFYRHPEIYNLGDYLGPGDASRYRLTLDTPEDWEVIKRVVQALGGARRIIPTREIVRFLEDNPKVAAMNAHVEQKPLGA